MVRLLVLQDHATALVINSSQVKLVKLIVPLAKLFALNYHLVRLV